MAKKNGDTVQTDSDLQTVPEMADLEGKPESAMTKAPTVSSELVSLKPLELGDDIDLLDVVRSLKGESSREIEVISAGKTAYWPGNTPRMVVAGRLQGVREVPTRLVIKGKQLKATLYTLLLTQPCYGMVPSKVTADGEVLDAHLEVIPSGKIVTVLERAMLRDLRFRMGQEVFIGCKGKQHSANGFDYYEYVVVGMRQTAAEVQASAQMAMAHMQAKAMEQSNPPNE